jgi:nucleotide-binding universal stress UspA family protein
MKTVLVLTDFSKNSKHAAETALFLAGKLQLNVLLFNIYFSLPVIPAGENDAWSRTYDVFKKESEANLQFEAERLATIYKAYSSGAYTPDIQYKTAFGDLGEQISALTEEKDIDFMVMGAREKQPTFLLFGDDINAVLRKALKPVLIVHDTLNFEETKKMVLTSDLAASDVKTIEFLSDFSNRLNFKMYVAYASPDTNIPDMKEEEKVAYLKNAIEHIGSGNITFQQLKGDNIIKELVNFNAMIGADLVAIVSRKRSLLWRIFHDSVSKELIANHHKSILIIPEEMV